jgi:hypothetical protein
MTNDPAGQAIFESLDGSFELLKEVEGSISSVSVGAIKPS